MSDEARAEAAHQAAMRLCRWSEDWGPFELGATWQAERDAERVAELEALTEHRVVTQAIQDAAKSRAEVKQLRRLTEAQAERSAANLARAEAAEREVARLNEVVAAAHARHGMATDWGERLQAKLDAVRAVVESEKHWNEACGWDVPAIRLLAALDGGDET